MKPGCKHVTTGFRDKIPVNYLKTRRISDRNQYIAQQIFTPGQMETLNTITIQAVVYATAEKIWEYYTAPEHIIRWNHASDDWHTTRAENDLKPGGEFHSRMEAKDGSAGFDFWGTYTAVRTNEFIAYTMGDGRNATVSFTATGDKTRIEIAFDPENSNPLEMQRDGWQAILDNFKTYAEAKVHEDV